MATTYYVDDGGDDSDGLTMAKAKNTFEGGRALLAAGDIIRIGANTVEALASNTDYVFPGTPADPNIVISVNVSTEVYEKATAAQIDSSGGVRDINIGGNVKWYGVFLKIGDDLLIDSQNDVIFFDDSEIELTSTNAKISIGNAQGENEIHLKNTDINFSSAGINAGIAVNNASLFIWEGGTLSIGATNITGGLFRVAVSEHIVRCSGVDFSAMTGAMINVSGDGNYNAEFHHCLIDTGDIATGTIVSTRNRILFVGVDDTTGNDLYRLEYFTYYGTVFHDDAVTRSGGASDGTQSLSWKMVTAGNALEFTETLISPPIIAWVDSTGAKTFSISAVWDSASDIQDDEAWIEVEALNTASGADTESDVFRTNRMTDIRGTPADQENNTETWAGTSGFGTVNKIDLKETITINRVGPVIVRVYLAKPSTTFYIDPKVVVT